MILAAVEERKKEQESWSDGELVALKQGVVLKVLAERIRDMYGSDDSEQTDGESGKLLIKLIAAKAEGLDLTIDASDLFSPKGEVPHVETERDIEPETREVPPQVSQSETPSDQPEPSQVSKPEEDPKPQPASSVASAPEPTEEPKSVEAEQLPPGQKTPGQTVPAQKTVAVDLRSLRAKRPTLIYGWVRYPLSFTGLHLILDHFLTYSSSLNQTLVNAKNETLWEGKYSFSPDESYFITALGSIGEEEGKPVFAYAKVVPKGTEGQQLTTLDVELFTSSDPENTVSAPV